MEETEIKFIKSDAEERKWRKYKCAVATLLPIGIAIALLGVFSPIIFRYVVEKRLVLAHGSEAYNNWQKAPIPVYMKFYIFNYTNVDDILRKSAKPSVSQCGPYTYREVRVNQVVGYNAYNITYVQNYSYVFEANKSCSSCKESDIVFSPKISTMTLLEILHKSLNGKSWIITWPVNLFLKTINDFKLFQALTVRELIWGYEDKLLEDVKNLENILKTIGFKLPPPQTFISLRQNGTAQAKFFGNFTILTGKENISHVQRIIRWRGLNKAPYWLTKYGRMINGTDGTHAPPFLSRDYKFQMFVPELCRSMYSVYQSTHKFKNIDVYRFMATADLFINSTVNPDNAAFCSKDRCWPSGMLPISECVAGKPPIFMSSPHFYQGDAGLVKAVNGMHPNASLHSTYLDVEPTTGITIRARKRLQVNVMAHKSAFLSKSKPLENEYNFLPVIYVSEEADIDDANAKKVRDEVIFPKTYFANGRFVVVALGCLLILSAFVVGVRFGCKQRDNPYKQLDDKSINTIPPQLPA